MRIKPVLIVATFQIAPKPFALNFLLCSKALASSSYGNFRRGSRSISDRSTWVSWHTKWYRDVFCSVCFGFHLVL